MTKEIWVGLFFILGIFLAATLTFMIDDEGHLFKKGYVRTYKVRMDSVGQVNVGSIVRLGGTGIKIGRVDEINLEPNAKEDGYELELVLSLKEKPEIKVDSTARLAMTTILQGMHVEITPGTPRAEKLPEGSLIPTVKSKSLMDSIAGIGDLVEGLPDGGLGQMLLGTEGLENVGKILAQLSSDGGLGKWILGTPAQQNLEPTIAEFRSTIENVRKATDEGSKGTLARVLHDEELGQNVSETVADLRESMKGMRKFAADITESKSVIARLASDEELGEKLDGIITDMREVAADLRGGKSALSKLIGDEKMGEDLAVAVAGISSFANDLATKEGTLQKLVSDPDIANELKKLVGGAREAIEDAREAAPISAFTSILFGALQ
ncbi:MAG: MlaD family protein [Planctomycetota bacterium]|jgi:phospholipid/cholesterol/gamma-HCH transport system substrate-binding protein